MSPLTPRQGWVFRYPIAVRISHWVNALSLLILVMSGLQIFNAHPALYWGDDSDFDSPILSISAVRTAEGRPVGVTRVLGRSFETTGVLGWSRLNGRPVQRAFPAWATIPSFQDLATGRVWHLFFAWVFVINGALYCSHSILSRRLPRELIPRTHEWREIGSSLRKHLTPGRQRGPDAASYNVLQKLAYVGVVYVLAPIAVLTGLTMSPAVDAAAPWLLDAFGGRQSARTIHFVLTGLFGLFVLVHVVMILVTGVFNNMRSMITGWYRAGLGDA